MKGTCLNTSWEFTDGEPSGMSFVPQKTEMVHLPHDFIIGKSVDPQAASGAEGGFYPGAVGTYTKKIQLSAEEMKMRHVLCLDGCAGSTKVIANGHLAARHHYAYTPFDVDITPYLTEGENRISVVASNTDQPNARWYTGGGLYRGVELLEGPLIHIANHGVFTYTSSVSDNVAVIGVEVTVENHSSCGQTVSVNVDIYDRVNPFFTETEIHPDSSCASSNGVIWVEAGASCILRTQIPVQNPRLWNLDTPCLYEARASIHVCGGIHPDQQKIRWDGAADDNTCDQESTIFGIRQITVDAVNGLRLNGKTIKLKGGCIHHDNGIIGAAAWHDSEYRKVLLHKKNGFMALRMAHNPPLHRDAERLR